MHAPNKDVHHSIESCPHTVGLVFVSQSICRIIPAIRECLYSTSWCCFGTGMVRHFEASLVDSWYDDYFSMYFLPAMAFNHISMTYKLELLKNHLIHNLLAMCSSVRMYWQWVWPKLHSLLSPHHLIGTYFLTTESDKRMCLLTLTILYGTYLFHVAIFLFTWYTCAIDLMYTIYHDIFIGANFCIPVNKAAQ